MECVDIAYLYPFELYKRNKIELKAINKGGICINSCIQKTQNPEGPVNLFD